MKKVFYGVAGIGTLLFFTLYAIGFFNSITFETEMGATVFSVLNVLLKVNVIWIGLVIFLENDNPSRTLAWLIVLILLPLLGFFLYVLFGRSYRKKNKAKRKHLKDSDRMVKAAQIQSGLIDYMTLPNSDKEGNKRLMQLLLNNAKAPFSLSNKVTVLTNGTSKFSRMFEAIRRAESHIHLEYFIIKDDTLGSELKNLLIEKALQGVEVRLIYDDVGSWRLSKKYLEDLKNAGVEVYAFFKVPIPVFSRELNYRNHRKITVVDGVIGFVGGLNIGDEYMGYSTKFSFWRDTHLELKGEAVYALQTIFLNDWNFVSNQRIEGASYFPEVAIETQSLVQIAASGPDSEWKCILQAFYKMIANAEDKIWIATPYLVPEESLTMGLKTAALSGVDVRIIIPSEPDHFFVYWASQANIQQLLEAGVRIYRYANGFIHSKVIVIDRQVASVGTANLDIRSMEINFEVNAFLYDEAVIVRLEEDFINDFEDSVEYNLENFNKRKLRYRFLEAMGRLVSPLQ
jgi:cardiolipin synthase